MDDLLEFVLELIDNLTGNKLDYGIGKLTRKLTRSVRNPKLRKTLQFLFWLLLFALTVALLTVIMLVFEAL